MYGSADQMGQLPPDMSFGGAADLSYFVFKRRPHPENTTANMRWRAAPGMPARYAVLKTNRRSRLYFTT